MGCRLVGKYGLALVVGVAGLLAGCGSSSSSKSTSSGAANGSSGTTATAPRRGFAPGGVIDRGYYAGVTCSDSHCSDFDTFWPAAQAWCKQQGWSGKPVELPRVESRRRPLYICFQVTPANPSQRQANPNLVRNFYAKSQLILTQGHVSTDSFSTSENGQNIDGEWNGSDEVHGKFGPSGNQVYYQARLY